MLNDDGNEWVDSSFGLKELLQILLVISLLRTSNGCCLSILTSTLTHDMLLFM